MVRFKRTQNILIVILSAGLLFIIIPAVLFANSQDDVNRTSNTAVSQTIPTRTITSTNWLPIIIDEELPTPTIEPTTEPTPTVEPTATAAGCLPDPALETNDATVEDSITSAINQHRSDNSIASYITNDPLVQAARRHALDMANLNDSQLGSPHTGSDGTTSIQRISQACYSGSFTTEIVGWGWTTIDQMMGFWKGSPVHNPILLHTNLNEFGPAYMKLPESQYKHYWVVTFGVSASNRQSTADLHQCTYRVDEPGMNRGLSVSLWQAAPCGE
ncbi:MAG: hypothetical protein ACI9EW_004038 [Cellvibrionaceae bacterium]|jgi:uncharacterized protein YkwD